MRVIFLNVKKVLLAFEIDCLLYYFRMKWNLEEFKKNTGITEKELNELFELNKNSKEFLCGSKHDDVLLFEVKIRVNRKYKETFYINAIQIGLKTVDMIFYGSYDEALKEIDSIIIDTIQETLF